MALINDVEALLFAAGKFVTVDYLAEMAEVKPASVKKALQELKEEYAKADHSLAILETNDLWKMNVKEPFLPMVRKIVSDTELERPVLETLAVIAWKRPILQSEVISVRGDGAYEHIRELLNLGFITRDKFKRTYKVKLSEKFFEYFDVEGDQDMREIFANVEKPQVKQMGELEVVDIEKQNEEQLHKDLEEDRLGELDVVNVGPLEKLKKEQVHLDEIETQLNKISASTDESIKEFEKYKPEESVETYDDGENPDDQVKEVDEMLEEEDED